MKINYVGRMEKRFSTGVCPSGQSYQVAPGQALNVADGDGEWLIATYPELYRISAPPVIKRTKKDDEGE